MNALLTAIVTWLAINFGLPASYDHPAIEVLPADRLVEIRHGSGSTKGPREVIAVYDDASNTIFLSAGWSGRTPAELSTLVHEMLHHLQNAAGMTYACPAARERLAYAAQGAWLALFGQSLAEAFELDAMTLKLKTRCLPY